MSNQIKNTRAAMQAVNSLLATIRNQRQNEPPPPKFKLIDSAIVDGKQWYTIDIVDKEIWFWLTQQEGTQWHHYTGKHRPLVDLEEGLYALLLLRWS
jgi:hypothetical protein